MRMVQDLLAYLLKFGEWGLFFHSFADAIIFPIPAFFLQVPLSLMYPSDAIRLATIGYIACLLGTPIGYLLGKLLGKSVLYKLLKKEWIDKATDMFQKNGQMAILIGAFTPIPFKVFTILSGCLNFPLWRLMILAALGRAVKFYLVGTLFYFYGRAAESMLGRVTMYVSVGAIALILLVWFIRRKINARKAKQVAEETSNTSNMS